MWFFRKKKPSLTERMRGLTDAHSHLLPGVDDGVEAFEETLDILKLYEQRGVQAVWLTPHIMEDIPNTTEGLKARFAELQQAYTGPVQLHLAAEYMLDRLFEERLEQGDLLPWGQKGDHLLVETSYFNPPMGLQDRLRRILAKGYFPILAHPERYLYMDQKDYQALKDLGVRFQLNLPSLLGMYGKRVKERAEKLEKQGFYDYQGTDIHSIHLLEK